MNKEYTEAYTTQYPFNFRPGKRAKAKLGSHANRCQKRKNRRILAKASRKRNR